MGYWIFGDPSNQAFMTLPLQIDKILVLFMKKGYTQTNLLPLYTCIFIVTRNIKHIHNHKQKKSLMIKFYIHVALPNQQMQAFKPYANQSVQTTRQFCLYENVHNTNNIVEWDNTKNILWQWKGKVILTDHYKLLNITLTERKIQFSTIAYM